MVTHLTSIAQDRCHRCGGFMVREEIREVNQVGWRCVMCGEHIDPLILEHRRRAQTAAGGRRLLEEAGKAELN